MLLYQGKSLYLVTDEKQFLITRNVDSHSYENDSHKLFVVKGEKIKCYLNKNNSFLKLCEFAGTNIKSEQSYSVFENNKNLYFIENNNKFLIKENIIKFDLMDLYISALTSTNLYIYGKKHDMYFLKIKSIPANNNFLDCIIIPDIKDFKICNLDYILEKFNGEYYSEDEDSITLIQIFKKLGIKFSQICAINNKYFGFYKNNLIHYFDQYYYNGGNLVPFGMKIIEYKYHFNINKNSYFYKVNFNTENYFYDFKFKPLPLGFTPMSKNLNSADFLKKKLIKEMLIFAQIYKLIMKSKIHKYILFKIFNQI